MNAKDIIADIGPKTLAYRVAHAGLAKPPMPINLTYSVTNRCQSRCKTCSIWDLYRHKPDLQRTELTIDEIEKMFRSMGHVYYFNISGGCPFLRKDLPDIVELALKYLTPGIIHTPTNALMPARIEAMVTDIMERIERHAPGTPFTIKPSFDGVGEKHDDIRGVPGNYAKVLETVERLKGVRKRHPNLHVGLGTVVSRFNVHDIEEVAEAARALDVDSYINEVAEERSELFNSAAITPDAATYRKAMTYFKGVVRADLKTRKPFERIQQSFRLVYYDLVVRILAEKRQVIPCYGGVSNVHISAYGDVWPCCILGYNRPMGNVRETDYDFRAVWRGRQAEEVRRFIREGGCACPLANQSYSNMLCHTRSVLKAARHMVFA